MIDSGRLVFVGGLHRSGTTVLAHALSEHPAISGLTRTSVREDEGQHLQSVYPAAKTYGGPGRFALAERAHLTEASPLATPQNAQLLLDAWAPYWDLEKTYLVEKSPPNLLMTRFLQAMFPAASHVIVVRHPIVVALSTKKWARRRTVEQLVEHNLRAYELFDKDAASLRRVHVLRYEELVRDPARELGRVSDFLGLSSPIPTSAVRTGHSRAYEDRWAQYLSGGPISRHLRHRIEQKYGERLQSLGYYPDDLTRLGPVQANWARRGNL